MRFPGAPYITIVFDPLTSTEVMSDYVTFYKDETCTQQWGQFSGTPVYAVLLVRAKMRAQHRFLCDQRALAGRDGVATVHYPG